MEGPPPTLDPFAAKNNHIVFAKVSSVFPHADGLSATVRLQVVAGINGERQTKQIELVLDRKLICPAPDRLKEGKRLLAFIKNREGKLVVPVRLHGSMVLSDNDVRDLVRKIRHLSTAKAVTTEELRQIDDFVGQTVSIIAQYSSDGGGNGILTTKFIPVRFNNQFEPPNGHKVTVTGNLRRRGRDSTAIYRLEDATWVYPPGPIQDGGSSITLPELHPSVPDPFLSDEQ